MGFKNFAACVAAQKKKGKSEESARKICGYLQKKAEGKELSELEIKKLELEVMSLDWLSDVDY